MRGKYKVVDNAVAEALFKTFKKEYIHPNVLESLEHLKLELFYYVNWYNNKRLHSSLSNLMPIIYKKQTLRKLSKKVLKVHHRKMNYNIDFISKFEILEEKWGKLWILP